MGKASFLFMGDTGRETERALIDAGIDLESDVLKAGHHGSAASTSAELLEAVRPRIVIVSAGEANTYGFPSPAFLARCGEAGAGVLRTDSDGAIEIRTSGSGLEVRTAAARRPRANPDFRLTRTTKSMIIAVD